jgi:hypothetical protein
MLITADSTGNTAVWTATLTNDDGSTETVTYTEDGSPTVAEIAAGLVAAWNLSLKPHIKNITAAYVSGGTFTLTADTAGVPFSVALSDNDDGTHTETITTANVGNNDANTTANWELDAAPANTNDLIFNAGSVSVKYGLDQSAAAIADFRVMPGCSSQFGRFDNGKGHYLIIDPDLFRYEGSGSLAMFNIGSANIAAYIKATGSPAATGYHTVYFKGSNVTTLTVDKGNVGVAALDGDTATVATVQIGYVSTAASDSNVTIGSGVTLTTLNQGAGICELKCAATTVTVGASGTLTTTGSGAITTVNVYGTAYLNSTGTITTLNVYGTADFSQLRTARTVTTTNLYPGATLKWPNGITFTNKPINATTSAGSATLTFVG